MPAFKQRKVALGAGNIELVEKARRDWYGKGADGSFDAAVRALLRAGLREYGLLPENAGGCAPRRLWPFAEKVALYRAPCGVAMTKGELADHRCNNICRGLGR